jgi:hypothetical protein
MRLLRGIHQWTAAPALLVAAMLMASCSGGDQGADGGTGWSEAEAATVAAYAAAFNAQDIDAIMDLYAELEPALPTDSRFAHTLAIVGEDLTLDVDTAANSLTLRWDDFVMLQWTADGDAPPVFEFDGDGRLLTSAIPSEALEIPPAGVEAQNLTAEEETALAAYVAAFNAEDTDAIMALYAEPPAHGLAAPCPTDAVFAGHNLTLTTDTSSNTFTVHDESGVALVHWYLRGFSPLDFAFTADGQLHYSGINDYLLLALGPEEAEQLFGDCDQLFPFG